MGRPTRGGGSPPGDPRLRIAVTGATGYIGQHVVAELARRGQEATLAARTTPPRPPMKFVSLDVAAPPSDAFALLGSPDTLIHLAWGGLPNYKAAHHVDRELPAHVRFLTQLVREGLRNLVVTGTCLEYGLHSGALHEGIEPAPTTAYGSAKNSLRAALQELQRATPFNLTWARLFYSYGRGQATSLLAQLRAAAESKDRVFRMSGGEQQRDYLPVADVAGHIVSLALTGANNGVVNVCSGTPVTVNALVEGWIREHHWSVTLERGHYPYPDYEPMAFWGDPTKLHRCLASTRNA